MIILSEKHNVVVILVGSENICATSDVISGEVELIALVAINPIYLEVNMLWARRLRVTIMERTLLEREARADRALSLGGFSDLFV